MAVEPKPVAQAGIEAAQAAQAEPDARPSWRKIALLGVVVGGLMAIVYLSPLRAYVSDLREVSARIRSLGMVGPAVVTLGVAMLVAIGFPRLALCVIAGMALGFWSGLLWAQLGTLLGNYAIFLIAGSSGRVWAENYLAKRHRLRGLIQEEGTWGVILARQIPVPGLIVNLACGLFGVRHRHFLLGTAIGQLPEAIPCTLIGAGALEASFAKSAGVISLAVAVSVLVWVGLRRFIRARASRTGQL
jgi:uncharacterized membrane protein YdjX (TVP38/TMEM64 family)